LAHRLAVSSGLLSGKRFLHATTPQIGHAASEVSCVLLGLIKAIHFALGKCVCVFVFVQKRWEERSIKRRHYHSQNSDMHTLDVLQLMIL